MSGVMHGTDNHRKKYKREWFRINRGKSKKCLEPTCHVLAYRYAGYCSKHYEKTVEGKAIGRVEWWLRQNNIGAKLIGKEAMIALIEVEKARGKLNEYRNSH